MQNLARRASDPPPVSKESIKPTILEENATEMFTNINDVENKKLLEGLSKMLNNKKAIIAGGAILSIINKEVVSDYDLYVHKSYAKEIIKYLLDNTGDLSLEVKNNTPAYDQSFFKKNNIIGRLLFKVNDDILKVCSSYSVYIDFKGLTMTGVERYKHFISLLSEQGKVNGKNFLEKLEHVYIINPPFMISNVSKILLPLMDKIVKDKIVIT